MAARPIRESRTGGVYIAVLATALVVALLSVSALVGQRLQNRAIVAATDIRQAQLNANSAVELALLAMKQDTNWRTTYTNGNWFVKRSAVSGTCTVNVTDPVDANLANNPDDPVVVLGIGYSGNAEQRVKVTVDPRKDPLSCLRSAIAVGDAITLSGDTLRANNALISANQISASSSQVYGNVESVSKSGSTYNGTTTLITSEKRPTMPDWTSCFSYYRTNGVQLNINSLPTWSTMNVARNAGLENSIAAADWFVGPTGSTADIDQGGGTTHSGSKSLRVRNRSDQYTGPAQPIDGYVKSGQQYYVEAYVYHTSSLAGIPLAKTFRISLYTKGTSDSSANISYTDMSANSGQWSKISTNINATAWTGNLEYAYVKFGCTDKNVDFFLDDVVIRETTTGRMIYQKVLSPSVDQLYTSAPTDPSGKGIYWIDCGGNKLVIERSRILGTLLIVNPGANSCINNGPISWSPAVAGYPALLVDSDNGTSADFAICATNRALSEKENGVNYNLVGAAHEDFGQDADSTDIYRSEIRGLIAVRHDLTFQNRALVRGQVIVGDAVNNSSGELEIEYLPDSLLNPPPGFTAPYTYFRRPASLQKAVAP